MRFRIGLNLGDVIDEKGRLYGDGANVAERLESLAEPYGILRKYADIFELQGDIVQAIVAKLAIKTFRYAQARALRKKPADLLAYDDLLRGYAYYHQRNRSAYSTAKEMFAKAIDLDPLGMAH